MRYKNLRTVILCCGLSCVFGLESYANAISDNLVKMNENHLEYVQPELKENEYGYTYNYDKNGNILFGYSFDSVGNIYYTEPESVGPSANKVGVLKNTTDKNGLSYDESGHLINPMTYNLENWKDTFDSFENGEVMYFDTWNEVDKYLSCYFLQYALDTIYPEQVAQWKCKDGKWQVYRTKTYDRESMINAIREKYGELDGDTVDEKLVSVYEKLKDTGYDLDYVRKSVSESLIDNKAVCWHYAKIAKVLLDDAGINSEVWWGKLVNSSPGMAHTWLRINEDKYYYCDPTVGYSDYWNVDLSYSRYLRWYTFLSDYFGEV
jgi:hypothetical protein